MKRNILIFLIILNQTGCYSQDSQKFGTRGIDHLQLANKFVHQLQNGQFDLCYQQLSDDYKKDISFDDFKNRGKCVTNLCSSDPLVYYETNYIGKTAEVDLKRYRGEEVTKDIMPEFDFTLKSLKENKCKLITLFLRFEHEDSDKIAVLDYFKSIPIHSDCSPAKVYENPFFKEKFFLLVQSNGLLSFDMNGRTGIEIRRRLKRKINDREMLTPITEGEISNILEMIAKHHYKFIYVTAKDQMNETERILQITDDKGIEVELLILEDVKQFMMNYEGFDPFPIHSKLGAP